MMANRAAVTVCGLQLYERSADTYTNTALVDVTGPTAQIALSLIGFSIIRSAGRTGQLPDLLATIPSADSKIFLATDGLNGYFLSYPFRTGALRWLRQRKPAVSGGYRCPARPGRVSGRG